MTSIFLTDKTYGLLKERFEHWQRMGYPDIDSGLESLLEQFNSLPGVVTISSCIGHRETTKKPRVPFYVYMACTADGWEYLQRIYHTMASRLLDVNRIYAATSETSRGNPRSFMQVQPKDFSLQMSFKELALSAEELLIYHCFGVIAKGTYYGPTRENFLKEFSLCFDKIAT